MESRFYMEILWLFTNRDDGDDDDDEYDDKSAN